MSLAYSRYHFPCMSLSLPVISRHLPACPLVCSFFVSLSFPLHCPCSQSFPLHFPFSSPLCSFHFPLPVNAPCISCACPCCFHFSSFSFLSNFPWRQHFDSSYPMISLQLPTRGAPTPAYPTICKSVRFHSPFTSCAFPLPVHFSFPRLPLISSTCPLQFPFFSPSHPLHVICISLEGGRKR